MASDQIVVAGEFTLYVAPNDDGSATLPTDSTSPLDPVFTAVGLTTRDGSSFSVAPEIKTVESHQSKYPTRTFKTKVTGQVQAALQEWNDSNFVSAFGGGSVTEPDPSGAPGEYRYDPPSGSALSVVAVVLEVVDGTKNYRFVVESAQAASEVNLPFTPDAETSLPLALDILGNDTTQPWHLLTNDPAFNPAA